MQISGSARAPRAQLRYSFGSTSLDSGSRRPMPVAVLVACRESGVCAILLGETREELLSELQERFPSQAPRHDPEGLAETLQQVSDLVAGRRPTLESSLAPEGTAFQQRVWGALRAISPGTTVTYAQLGETLGLPPSAVRAVAGACAANPCAVAIPCHRVVRGDGGLAGYRWGVERKRALLQGEAERTAAATPFTLVP